MIDQKTHIFKTGRPRGGGVRTGGLTAARHRRRIKLMIRINSSRKTKQVDEFYSFHKVNSPFRAVFFLINNVCALITVVNKEFLITNTKRSIALI